MPREHPRRTAAARVGIAVVAGTVMAVVTGGLVACGKMDDSPSPSTGAATLSIAHAPHSDAPSHAGDGRPGSPGGAIPAGLDVADGGLPDGVSVFATTYPAITNLDSALLQALRDAATDAGRDGIEFVVNSGWRSARYQQQLLQQAITEYGSRKEAVKWVATPRTSAHVVGDAVDLGPAAALTWLSEHGATYGLCQTYLNEPWHYEVRPEARHDGCPRPYADPTDDPRMQ